MVADQLPAGSSRPRFRSQLVARGAVGRPSIAISPSGALAVIYESAADQLQLARRRPSGKWSTTAARITGTQPLLAPSTRGFVEAALGAPPRQRRRQPAQPVRSMRRSRWTLRLPARVRPGTTGAQPVVAYVEEQLQLVIVDQPGRPNGLQVAGTTSGIGSFSAIAGTKAGRIAVAVPRAKVRADLAGRAARAGPLTDLGDHPGAERRRRARPGRKGCRCRLLGSGRPAAGCGEVLPETGEPLPAAADHRLSADLRAAPEVANFRSADGSPRPTTRSRSGWPRWPSCYRSPRGRCFCSSGGAGYACSRSG